MPEENIIENESTEVVVENTEERPAWLPEKFSTPQAFADSYSQLEKKFHSEKPEGITKEEPAESTGETEEVSLDQFYSEYRDTGSLSEESYAALQSKHNLDKASVERIIQLENGAVEVEAQKIFDGIEGGREAYQAALIWAKSDYSEADTNQFNRLLEGDASDRDLVISKLMSRFQAAGNPIATSESEEQEPTGNITNAAANSGGLAEKYSDINDYHKDVSTKRYRNDPVFRAEVVAKFKRSSL